jgi:hypothetical protein
MQGATYLHIGIPHYSAQVLQYTDPRRRSRVKPRQRIWRKDHLVVMLYQEVEHMTDQYDQSIDGTIEECPWQFRSGRWKR